MRSLVSVCALFVAAVVAATPAVAPTAPRTARDGEPTPELCAELGFHPATDRRDFRSRRGFGGFASPPTAMAKPAPSPPPPPSSQNHANTSVAEAVVTGSLVQGRAAAP